jgi:hypothetical protein
LGDQLGGVMGFKSIIRAVEGVGEVALPIAAAFGVPEAATIEQAVNTLRGQGKHDDAAALAARAQDALDQRLAGIEARITVLEEAVKKVGGSSGVR